MRAFLGIDLPDAVDFDLQLIAGGIRGARWQRTDQLHLTLHFLDELDGGTVRRLVAALARVDVPPFELELRGAGLFPLRGQPRTLWVGVAPPDPVRLLHTATADVLDGFPTIERERRKFSPHVTVARMRQPEPREVEQWIAGHVGYASPRFSVDAFHLYSSVLSNDGPKYRIEASFPLEK